MKDLTYHWKQGWYKFNNFPLKQKIIIGTTFTLLGIIISKLI